MTLAAENMVEQAAKDSQTELVEWITGVIVDAACTVLPAWMGARAKKSIGFRIGNAVTELVTLRVQREIDANRQSRDDLITEIMELKDAASSGDEVAARGLLLDVIDVVEGIPAKGGRKMALAALREFGARRGLIGEDE